ncbi:hypothetical protein EIL87_07915 [Saccharopolyspora rhizosphaerae]|uniref:Uncharacterized protein n=1 Tax=Saccharopolyspora rhizosphaerae TaxID=2492662 RepID=A0A426JYE8_9PSEU|nr:hypothetical protein [Saccharopolyspora rhizosphaerae]RRO18163.1 hypothetical protein EIL87_07915 [Saccharopolyspora rhizosphaerae]
MAQDEETPREARPGYRDWRKAPISIVVVVVLGVVFVREPDHAPYAAIAVGVAFLAWRLATARRDG